MTNVRTATVEANYDRISVHLYTDEDVAGLEECFPAPGLLQGETCHGC
jgi:L-alanine-DL-glutamate epimerase-like enolase superfamily enzyme